jgi:hypothetical protein
MTKRAALRKLGVGSRDWRQSLITRGVRTRGLGVGDRRGTHDHLLPPCLAATGYRGQGESISAGLDPDPGIV